MNELNREYAIQPLILKTRMVDRIINSCLYRITFKKRNRSIAWMKIKGKILSSMMKHSDAGIFFAPAASELISFAKVPEGKKLIYLSDATYHAMIDYYWYDETKEDQRIGNEIEKNALNTSDAIIFSSKWAARDAVEYYHISAKKIKVLPFGANLKDAYEESNAKARQKRLQNSDKINVLLVGVDWKRKGIDLAIECIQVLNKRQKERIFNLTILGFDSNQNVGAGTNEHISFAGRLDKNKPDEYNQIIQYYKSSDIFLLPTKAECSAIVFSEASMFGLPIFTHDTGGTTTYVEDDVTGRCLPLGSTAEDFANAILHAFDSQKIEEYARNARKKYEDELNWDKWLESFKQIVNDLENE